MNYVPYHVHTDLSLLDSATKHQAYIDEAVKNGQTAIAFTEHGNIYNWIAKKVACDEAGIKYIHGVECYLTEQLEPKVRDNYHTVLLAKNQRGVMEINSLISVSEEEDHKYYKPRLSFDEFLAISDNVIKISACLASPLNKLPLEHLKYEALVKHYDYLEIQPHDHPEQAAYNIHLTELSRRYGKPLIAGTDTHSLNSYKAECRSILQEAKGIQFSDEDAFDLTYKTYEQLVEAFRKQDALPEDVWKTAIENTNIMADSVESFELDRSFKYPKMYGDEDSELFEQNVWNSFREKISDKIIPKDGEERYADGLREEIRVLRKLGMEGFMLSMSEFVRWCKKNDIPVGPGRGSVAGSRVAFVTDITDVDPGRWKTMFSRFCNEHRKEIGDIDIDLPPDDRDKLYDYIIERFGVPYTGFILSIGTISSKGTIDEICRALSHKYENEAQNPYTIEATKRIKAEFEVNEERAKEKHPEVFYYYDGLVDTAISQSMHPAGIVVSPVTLPDNYGVFRKDGRTILQIDMECVHEVSLVKYDILGLKNIQILKDACTLIGIPYPTSTKLDFEDEDVWADIKKSPVGIFQFEGEYAHSMLRQYDAKSIYDMSLVTAAIRPSGASYRNQLMQRIPHKNPSPLIDKLLAENNGYLVYQEDTLKFLQEICGLSGGDADNVRRAIGRKEQERLDKALPEILEGYCKMSCQPREIAEREAKEFLQILKDSASYQFGYNHSISYCIIGYMCAYLRYYYPHEFITAYLNRAANDDDIKNGSLYAQENNIRITSPRFGVSKDNYFFDKESNLIAKGIASIKHLNSRVANDLYHVYHNYENKTFMQVLKNISEHTDTDSRQLSILINIGYFDEFGNIPTLARIRSIFDYFKQGAAKTVKAEKVAGTPLGELIAKHATNINAKGVVLKTYTITDMDGLLEESEAYVRNLELPGLSLKDRIQNQVELLGYADITTGKREDRMTLIISDVIPMKDKKTGKTWAYRLMVRSIGTGKNAALTLREATYKKKPIRKGDIIKVPEKGGVAKNDKGFWYLYSYEITA